MARPHRRRDPIPTMEQLHSGLDAVEASASPERLLDMWLDREEPREAWEHPVVLEDGTEGPDPRKFKNRPSTDPNGDNTTIRAKLPASWMQRVSTLIARRVHAEYNTNADFVRDAIYHHLWRVAGARGLDADAVDHLRIVEAGEAARNQQAVIERNDELVATMRQTLDLLRGKPGMDGYLQTVRGVAAYLEEPWLEQALELLDRYDPQGRAGRVSGGVPGHVAGNGNGSG